MSARLGAGVIAHPNTPLDLRQTLLNKADSSCKQSIAESQTASDDILRLMAKEDRYIARQVIRNPNCPKDLFAGLLAKISASEQVVANHRCR